MSTDAGEHRIVGIGADQQSCAFPGNEIKTTKYAWLTFLPQFFLEEFDPSTKIVNCYFLCISGMQCIPAITATNGYPTTLIPLTIVLLISGIFKVLEDWARSKADKKANSTDTEVFDPSTSEFKTVQWSAVRVGDLLRVSSRNMIPADMVTIQVAEEAATGSAKGICYVETKSLDGRKENEYRYRCTIIVVIIIITPTTLPYR